MQIEDKENEEKLNAVLEDEKRLKPLEYLDKLWLNKRSNHYKMDSEEVSIADSDH